MWDFITAILGGKHCGWCTDKPDSWLMRRFDGTGPRGDRPLLHQLWWRWMDVQTDRIRIWRLGQEWHWRFHGTTRSS